MFLSGDFDDDNKEITVSEIHKINELHKDRRDKIASVLIAYRQRELDTPKTIDRILKIDDIATTEEITSLQSQLQALKEEGNPRDHLHIGERAYRVEDIGSLADTLQASQVEVERLRLIMYNMHQKMCSSADDYNADGAPYNVVEEWGQKLLHSRLPKEPDNGNN